MLKEACVPSFLLGRGDQKAFAGALAATDAELGNFATAIA